MLRRLVVTVCMTQQCPFWRKHTERTRFQFLFSVDPVAASDFCSYCEFFNGQCTALRTEDCLLGFLPSELFAELKNHVAAQSRKDGALPAGYWRHPKSAKGAGERDVLYDIYLV
jgi:hypothetical protein